MPTLPERPTRHPMRRALVGAATAGALLAGAGGATASAASSSPPQDRGIVDIDTTLADGTAVAGTGMVLSSSPGIVLTNNHVIAGARRIVVTDVTTGRRGRAAVVGYDVADDVAVLRIAGSTSLPSVTIGDSSSMRVGDPVTAVGNVGGVGGTPTASSGAVTALHRAVTVGDGSGGSERLADVIQVSADLEPGDSGGPLLDSSGRVIGIDTAGSFRVGFRTSGASSGYAIPINVAMRIASRILAGQASSRVHVGATARLGVEIISLTRRPGAPGTEGAGVAGVVYGTPAARAGLGGGDVIVSLGGRRVRSAAGLTAAMQAHHPGDVVRVVWIDAAGARSAATVRLATGTPA